ncbi:uncharacterized protein B0H18DRAFT_1119902 [Fomitopsis serialis]|uniref:uncharacterized protein n=1 Tax=Fomitopsis serialis TaxID=139415 RepID=UPI0020082CF6|nr:uncharacterized protein B0H18DRAFT_1119902 [Neoantrodia serialis]KAH9924571.1 hypothetical protein B0H18DRAFT_1119902 [Neoantrodia serialis]
MRCSIIVSVALVAAAAAPAIAFPIDISPRATGEEGLWVRGLERRVKPHPGPSVKPVGEKPPGPPPSKPIRSRSDDGLLFERSIQVRPKPRRTRDVEEFIEERSFEDEELF